MFLLLSGASPTGQLVGESVDGLASVAFLWLCDIAPSSSRLHRFSSRTTVRRNSEEPFLLVQYRATAATPTSKFLSSRRAGVSHGPVWWVGLGDRRATEE